jgi:hypothetical protein
MSLATDDTLSSIWSRGLRGEELDPNDHSRFDLLLLNIVAMITAQIHAHQRGTTTSNGGSHISRLSPRLPDSNGSGSSEPYVTPFVRTCVRTSTRC